MDENPPSTFDFLASLGVLPPSIASAPSAPATPLAASRASPPALHTPAAPDGTSSALKEANPRSPRPSEPSRPEPRRPPSPATTNYTTSATRHEDNKVSPAMSSRAPYETPSRAHSSDRRKDGTRRVTPLTSEKALKKLPEIEPDLASLVHTEIEEKSDKEHLLKAIGKLPGKDQLAISRIARAETLKAALTRILPDEWRSIQNRRSDERSLGESGAREKEASSRMSKPSMDLTSSSDSPALRKLGAHYDGHGTSYAHRSSSSLSEEGSAERTMVGFMAKESKRLPQNEGGRSRSPLRHSWSPPQRSGDRDCCSASHERSRSRENPRVRRSISLERYEATKEDASYIERLRQIERKSLEQKRDHEEASTQKVERHDETPVSREKKLRVLLERKSEALMKANRNSIEKETRSSAVEEKKVATAMLHLQTKGGEAAAEEKKADAKEERNAEANRALREKNKEKVKDIEHGDAREHKPKKSEAMKERERMEDKGSEPRAHMKFESQESKELKKDGASHRSRDEKSQVELQPVSIVKVGSAKDAAIMVEPAKQSQPQNVSEKKKRENTDKRTFQEQRKDSINDKNVKDGLDKKVEPKRDPMRTLYGFNMPRYEFNEKASDSILPHRRLDSEEEKYVENDRSSAPRSSSHVKPARRRSKDDDFKVIGNVERLPVEEHSSPQSLKITAIFDDGDEKERERTYLKRKRDESAENIEWSQRLEEERTNERSRQDMGEARERDQEDKELRKWEKEKQRIKQECAERTRKEAEELHSKPRGSNINRPLEEHKLRVQVRPSPGRHREVEYETSNGASSDRSVLLNDDSTGLHVMIRSDLNDFHSPLRVTVSNEVEEPRVSFVDRHGSLGGSNMRNLRISVKNDRRAELADLRDGLREVFSTNESPSRANGDLSKRHQAYSHSQERSPSPARMFANTSSRKRPRSPSPPTRSTRARYVSRSRDRSRESGGSRSSHRNRSSSPHFSRHSRSGLDTAEVVTDDVKQTLGSLTTVAQLLARLQTAAPLKQVPQVSQVAFPVPQAQPDRPGNGNKSSADEQNNEMRARLLQVLAAVKNSSTPSAKK